jgi:hypothetical protein
MIKTTFPLLRTAAAGLAVLALTGCAASQQVRWETYSPILAPAIDSATAAKNCMTLDEALVYATGTSDEHAKATGISNDALVEYIRASMRRAGCV